ncbi:MAG: protein kinase, partial [Pseudomonadota bacterium]
MEPTDLVTQRAQARVGMQLSGRWRLDKLVGVGGMAAVYSATHRNTKRVAIKILHPEMAVDENARQRFLREGYAANQVGHRGAVAADDDGLTEEGVPFLVMELLEGETLEERALRHGGKLEAHDVLVLMDQALATLEA